MSPRWTSLGATLVLVAAVVCLLALRLLIAVGGWAVAIQGLAVLLMLWARVAFGARSFHAGANPTEGGLVTTGPYRFLRHPIYSAILFFVWAGAISHGATAGLGLALVASAAIAVRIAAEERLVSERYPEYADYAARTRRIVPFIF